MDIDAEAGLDVLAESIGEQAGRSSPGGAAVRAIVMRFIGAGGMDRLQGSPAGNDWA